MREKYLEDYKFYVGWDAQTLSHTNINLIYVSNYYLSLYHNYHPQSSFIYLCINLC